MEYGTSESVLCDAVHITMWPCSPDKFDSFRFYNLRKANLDEGEDDYQVKLPTGCSGEWMSRSVSCGFHDFIRWVICLSLLMHPRPDTLNYDIALVDFICYPLTGGHISCFERRSVRGELEENPHVLMRILIVASINYHLVCSHGSCHCPMSAQWAVVSKYWQQIALS